MLTYLGSLTIGGALPAVVDVLALAYTDLQAKATALAQAVPSFTPPSVQLQLAGDILTAVETNIALGIQSPSIDLQITLFLTLLAEVEAQLAVIVGITDLFAVAGVHAYVYDGDADALGGELTTELAGGFPGGGPTDHTNAIILATTIPSVWAAMSQIFKVTP